MNIKHLLFSTEGRINRGQWWFGNFLVILLAVALGAIFHVSIPHELSFAMFSFHNIGIGALLGALMFWSHVSLNAKRLHDLNMSGWFMVFLYIPILGYFIGFVILGCIEGGSKEDNAYGPPTKAS